MKGWQVRENSVSVGEILEYLDYLSQEYSFCGNRELSLIGFSTLQEIKSNTVVYIEERLLGERELEWKNKEVLVIAESGSNVSGYCAAITLNGAKDKYYLILERFYLEYIEKETTETRKVYKTGENVIIEENVYIIGPVVIGDNVVIKSGAVIGSRGFGFYCADGVRKEIPAVGTVIIGNNVEIGANTCIDSGMLGNTIIGDDVKIANLCHVAYNVIIGKETIIAARASVSAETVIGDRCFIGAGAIIKDNLWIGQDTFIGLGSVVKDNIYSKQTVFGNPAVNYVRKKKLLKVSNINKTFFNGRRTNNEKTLNNISFDIMDNEYVSIIGPSGCGKTTLLHIMCGLLKAEEGVVTLKGENNEIQNINMVFQEDALFPWLNLEKNVMLGLTIQGVDKQTKKEKAAWVLRMVGLSGYEKYYPHQLSGGMKKRAAIARCLVLNSSLLLMDEPFGALDMITKTALQKDLLALKEKEGFAVCMVTHDIEEAILLSDRIFIVKGKPAQIEKIVEVKLPFPRERGSREFLEVQNQIMEILEEKRDEV